MHKIFAQVDIGSSFPAAKNFNTVGSLVQVILRNAFVFAGLLFFVLIIGGGFAIVVGASSGDPHKADQGKKAVTGALLGLIIVAISVLIMQIVAYITGLDILKSLFQVE
jgi:hypothetical protein